MKKGKVYLRKADVLTSRLHGLAGSEILLICPLESSSEDRFKQGDYLVKEGFPFEMIVTYVSDMRTYRTESSRLIDTSIGISEFEAKDYSHYYNIICKVVSQDLNTYIPSERLNGVVWSTREDTPSNRNKPLNIPAEELKKDIETYNKILHEKTLQEQYGKPPAKYYTPTLEEFHTGFRFVIKREDDSLSNTEMDYKTYLRWAKKNVLYRGIGDKNIMVKCLDQEDIEELGWGFNSQAFKTERNNAVLHFLYGYGEATEIWYSLSYYPHDNTVEIIENDGDGEMSVFYGRVRNYNELKTVMKQVGI